MITQYTNKGVLSMAKQQNYFPQSMYNTYSNFYSVIPTSEFDGKLGGLIGRTLAAFLAFVFALAIFAAPLLVTVLEIVALGTAGLIGGGVLAFFGFIFACAWFSNIRQRWFARHTRVNGYRLKFTGKTWSLAFKGLKWFFACVFTVLIFALWLPIKVKKWRTAHTVIDDAAPIAEMQTFSQSPAIQQPLDAYYPGAYGNRTYSMFRK